jgi:hypothetical protein
MVLFFLACYIMVLFLLIFLHHDTFVLSLVYQLGSFLVGLVYHGTFCLSFVYQFPSESVILWYFLNI